MTRTHIPVLAGELIDAARSAPGRDRRRLHVRRRRTRSAARRAARPTGTLIAIDRDPTAEERFAELSAEVPCHTRFIRADFATALAELAEERLRADLVYLDLGMSSMQVDTWARGFSYAYDAPLDMRMDPEQELTAEEIVNTWDERRLARLLRDYGEERYASQIARAIVPRAPGEPLGTTQQLVDVIKTAVPVPAQFAGGHPAKRTFQALRIAVNDELPSSSRRCPRPGSCWRPAGGSRRSRSTRSRTGGSSASSPRGHAAASARRTCRSASAGTSPRPSS